MRNALFYRVLFSYNEQSLKKNRSFFLPVLVTFCPGGWVWHYGSPWQREMSHRLLHSWGHLLHCLTAKNLKMKLSISGYHTSACCNYIFWSPTGCFIISFGMCNVIISHMNWPYGRETYPSPMSEIHSLGKREHCHKKVTWLNVSAIVSLHKSQIKEGWRTVVSNITNKGVTYDRDSC